MNSTAGAHASWSGATRWSGLPERKDLKALDWTYNSRVPKRAILDLAALKSLDAKEDILIIGPPNLP